MLECLHFVVLCLDLDLTLCDVFCCLFSFLYFGFEKYRIELSNEGFNQPTLTPRGKPRAVLIGRGHSFCRVLK